MSFTQYLQAKGIYTGYPWKLSFAITGTGVAVFPAGAAFRAQVRAETADGPVLAELTTGNGGIYRTADRAIEINMPGASTALFTTASHVVLDVVRTDLSVPVHLGFDLKIPVNRSVTRT